MHFEKGTIKKEPGNAHFMKFCKMGNKFLKAEGIIKNATGIPSNHLFHDHQKLSKNVYLTTRNTIILSMSVM